MDTDRKRIYFNAKRDEGFTGKVLYRLYGIDRSIVRNLVLKLARKLLGQHCQFYSLTLRRIFKDYHGVEIGMYSHGSCFEQGRLPAGTVIGRYCSVANGVTVHNANHPMNLKSSHAFFFNPALGYSSRDIVPRTKLVIGNDVWLGQNCIILASCSLIDDGAIIGAGVVVNKEIPAYGVAVGHPCRVVRYRFSSEKIEEIRASKWWEKNIEELVMDYESFQQPIEGEDVR